MSERQRREEAWELLGAVGQPKEVIAPVGVPDTGGDPILALGPALWLDATRGLYTTAAGTTAATADADPVGRWEDQSGNGKHFTQTAVSAPDRRPILKTALYSKPVVQFDGIDDALVSSLDASGGMPTATVYITCEHTVAAVRQWLFSEATWRGSILFVSTTSIGLGDGSDPDGNDFRFTVSNPGAGLHVYTNANKAALYIDAATYTVKSNSSDGTNTTTAQFGARNSTPADLYAGGIGEVLAFNGVHDAATRAFVQAYLKAKWGTP